MKKKLTHILISIVILCSLVLSAFSVGAVQNTNSGLAQSSSKTQRSVLIGDIDNDGRVNVADILSLKNLIMTDQWSDEQLIRGDIDGNGTLNVSDILSVKNIIMNGNDTVLYTVTFNSMGGSEVSAVNIAGGNTVPEPVNPSREGYIFSGWYLDETTSESWNFSTNTVDRDITLYAGWTERVVTPTESLTYELDGDTYTVTGVGDEAVVVIPDSYEDRRVTAIRGHHGTGAFARKDIISVTIPDSITEIGQNTFNNCSELKEVMISENSNLTSIGNNAFSGNSSLESIYIPKGVTSIGDSAFNNCGALDSIRVAENNTVYSSEGNCLIEKATGTLIRGTNSTVIPDSVTAIAQAAFRRSSITEITVPASVTSIGNYVFQNTPIVSINYEGTTAQWNSITKARLWNMGIDSVKIYCTDGILNADGTEFQPPVTEGKTLIVYFSWSSNTERMANTIGEQTGGDILEIVPANDYPTEYSACAEIALAERDSNARPAIQDLPYSIDEYDNIMIGYPIWWHTAPMIIGTFLESYDLTGKDIYPFTQSASMDTEHFNNSMEFVRGCAKGATVHDGLFARYSDSNAIISYLESNNLIG